MAHAIEAPAGTLAEGPTSHTQNQVSRLTAPQLRLLHRPVDPKRIGKDDKGFAHMQAWDIKRYLIRVFGFAGYDTENRELSLVREIEIPAGNKSRWTVVYRAQVRLIVKDVHGRELAHWDGEAAGAGNNLPKLDDAHDMALKTATSQALKRAATNLGDSFGLSLYNDGSPAAVVNFSAAHPPEQWQKAAEPLPEPDDAPVKPEQGARADEAGSEQDQLSARSTDAPQPSDGGEQADPLPGLVTRYRAHWDNQFELVRARVDGKQAGVSERRVQGPPPASQWTTFDALLEARINELEADKGNTEGRAA
ncbi:MAG: hypothetical protein HOY79_04545 [Streptomyces sp.]|nr:hypothetical protein [Streptomyces sp.]NUS15474.1 hypothetical protein [Streptomyces sp.]NUS24067.1 hypothetical protein [Streptomyces sp.]